MQILPHEAKTKAAFFLVHLNPDLRSKIGFPVPFRDKITVFDCNLITPRKDGTLKLVTEWPIQGSRICASGPNNLKEAYYCGNKFSLDFCDCLGSLEN